MNTPKRYTITTALPYTNGPIHIGHLAGVYVPADIYARYLRLTGNDVVFIGGSDEHGVPITIKAKNEGVSPQDIVDKYHAIIKNLLKILVLLTIIIREQPRPSIMKLPLSFLKH
ncbi:methionyl-tRNA synthetase [Jejuia pallidilutea]|uniref:Methionyl-tRNA synthetase n=1 Tax=Jejuia pallidilutea TaxID=504487 RepID=A0A090VQI7_9FLAO|nr:methionyl-tRNA synthetase [Jejuia pallidilutea]